jgi:hypothetical protein
MPNANDMSRCLTALEQDSTIIAVRPSLWRPNKSERQYCAWQRSGAGGRACNSQQKGQRS